LNKFPTSETHYLACFKNKIRTNNLFSNMQG
jgi:hypothetical protein